MDSEQHVSPDGTIRMVVFSRPKTLATKEVMFLAQDNRRKGEHFCGASVVDNNHVFFYEKVEEVSNG